jgi:hypothetical protein
MMIVLKKFLTDPKRLVMVSLLPVSLCLASTAILLGWREVTLPFKAQIDELRLMDPVRVDAQVANAGGLAPELAEAKLISIMACQDSGEQMCSAQMRNLLKDNPAEGRLWLEYSRLIAQESGLTAEAVSALKKSYELSAREGWITNTRARFALSVWLELPPDTQDLVKAEIISTMDDFRFVGFLANIYITSPTSRAALGKVMEAATPEHQRAFLSLVNQKSNGG